MSTDLTKCPECDSPWKRVSPGGNTLLAYGSNCPHGDHDDNCKSRTYECEQGHTRKISIRRRCKCGWSGKAECFCHPDRKVTLWPDAKMDMGWRG